MIKHIIQRWINPSPSDWTGPPVVHTASGKLRRIGIELEFSGLGIEQIARIVKDVVGGSISPISPYECDVDDTPHGTYHIELDSSRGLEPALFLMIPQSTHLCCFVEGYLSGGIQLADNAASRLLTG